MLLRRDERADVVIVDAGADAECARLRHQPLDELVAPGGSGKQVLWLQGEIYTDGPGPIDLRIKAPLGTAAWLGARRIDPAKPGVVHLEKGLNRLTLRGPATAGAGDELTVEVQKTRGSPRRMEVVGGP
jgi:hypothetical protein